MVERPVRRASAVLGGLGLLALCLAYCLPDHPSARAAWLDETSHVGLFAVLAASGWLVLRRGWIWVLLAALGLVLEVAQWKIGGYRRLEWADVLANEAGVALAALLQGWRLFVRR